MITTITTIVPPPPATPVEVPAVPLAAPPAADVRVSTLLGDRCCANCGFNLHGQLIVRESHYGLLIVRCPECGHATALQEYPSLSPMAGRLRALMAAFWLAAVLVGFAITGGLIYGWTSDTTEAVLTPYVATINAQWTAFQTAQQSAGPQPANAWYPWANTQAMQSWWDGLPPSEAFKTFGAWRSLNWSGLITLVFALLTLFPLGMVWSVVFARLRGRRLLLPLVFPLLFGASFLIHSYTSSTISWYSSFQEMTMRQVGWPITTAAFIVSALCLAAGALSGRGLARAFLRLILPGRLLAAFSFLWIADNRPLPRSVQCARPSPYRFPAP